MIQMNHSFFEIQKTRSTSIPLKVIQKYLLKINISRCTQCFSITEVASDQLLVEDFSNANASTKLQAFKHLE